MTETTPSSLIALANTAVAAATACDPKYDAECSRIALRLQNFIAKVDGAGADRSNWKGLNDVLESIVVCMQAASTPDKNNWSPKMVEALGDNDVLAKIKEAERSFNTIMTKMEIEQGNVLMQMTKDFPSIDALLKDFGTMKMEGAQITMDDAIKSALEKYPAPEELTKLLKETAPKAAVVVAPDAVVNESPEKMSGSVSKTGTSVTASTSSSPMEKGPATLPPSKGNMAPVKEVKIKKAKFWDILGCTPNAAMSQVATNTNQK
jgi:hypothetical protein